MQQNISDVYRAVIKEVGGMLDGALREAGLRDARGNELRLKKSFNAPQEVMLGGEVASCLDFDVNGNGFFGTEVERSVGLMLHNGKAYAPKPVGGDEKRIFGMSVSEHASSVRSFVFVEEGDFSNEAERPTDFVRFNKAYINNGLSGDDGHVFSLSECEVGNMGDMGAIVDVIALGLVERSSLVGLSDEEKTRFLEMVEYVKEQEGLPMNGDAGNVIAFGR